MNETLRVMLILISLAVTFACYFLVVSAFFNKRVLKTLNVAKASPARSFGIGFVNFLFFGTIAVALFALADGVGNDFVRFIVLIPSLLLWLALTIILSLGLSAMVNILGERVFPELSAWKKSFWGTVILTFASALPFVGWFLLLPFVALTGFGAVILGFFQKGE
ncbi:MAG: hypothetical protein DCC56_07250 [Anaerolineae bacterium]|nr:MAG: hypothetical protein DCC56_07250 [Anaerolineae bacterium]WKZ43344.1 MAG: hypothetical protein QY302_14700 [Anaerolineales bacterium]